MLAGAVALAAGRFQPLLRLDSEKRFADVLSTDEVDAFARAVDRQGRPSVPRPTTGLGDDCDFLTIAGDWPYRYRDAKGEPTRSTTGSAGRSGTDERWAFAGRLLGDAGASRPTGRCAACSSSPSRP